MVEGGRVRQKVLVREFLLVGVMAGQSPGPLTRLVIITPLSTQSSQPGVSKSRKFQGNDSLFHITIMKKSALSFPQRLSR